MQRYSIRVEYVGKNYSGSQIQRVPNGCVEPKTIQGELEHALSTLIGECEGPKPNTHNNKRPIKAIFSGRTDRGVNSKGQIVHFETDKPIVASRFINSLNGVLPKDISVGDLEKVSNDFHAQKSALKRHYRYVFYNKKLRSAFDGDLLLVKWDLNIQRMKNALEYLEGEHDFSAFRKTRSTVQNTNCFIYKTSCQKLDDTVVIDIVGNRFLYNMVRTIVGTLLLIEKKDLPAEFIKKILEGKNRMEAGKTVSPYGLTLMKVEY